MVLVLRGKLVRLIQTRVEFVFIAWLKLTFANCPNGKLPLVGRTTSAHPRGPSLWLIIFRERRKPNPSGPTFCVRPIWAEME